MYITEEAVDVSVLMGKTLVSIENNDDEEIVLKTSEGETYRMFHYQDCCEVVSIEDITGDIEDLLHSPITMAEKVTQEGNLKYESSTWTFYKFATLNGYVTIRWFGSSNGYYSEEVDFVKVMKEE